uniref:DUF4795 domain-containing protein n=1 Tax=Myripristis murdjan TaxID=586833 RepID=A0A667WNB1_9TELE
YIHLDDLRSMLEDMMVSSSSLLACSLQDEAQQTEGDSQGLDQSQVEPAYANKLVDISRKISQLFLRYESLQDTCDNMLQQQPAGENVGLMNNIQSAILQLQGDCEKMHETTERLVEDTRQKQSHIEVQLYKTMQQLEEKKADKQLVEMEIGIKADKRALESKVSRMQFDSMTEQLSAMFHELLSKVTGQEQDWHKVMDKLSTEMECKVGRQERHGVVVILMGTECFSTSFCQLPQTSTSAGHMLPITKLVVEVAANAAKNIQRVPNMGPKKAPSVEEVDDIKRSLDFLTEEVSAVRLQQNSILKLVEEVKALRIQNEEKDKRLAFLESRVADLEQYSRINDDVISGLNIKARSYARAVTAGDGGEPDELDVSSTEQQVATFLQSKGIELDCNNIEACHLLPKKNAGDKPAVIMRFVNRKHKIALLKQGKKLKGSNVYINEHLIKRNADIAKKARYLRKQKKIQHTWTTNCKIFIKLNGTPEEAKVLMIRSIEELDKYQ